MLSPKISVTAAAIAALTLTAAPASAQLIFNITNLGNATPQMVTGVTQAAALWSAQINDPVTINLRINAAVLQTGQIAGTSPFFDLYSYTDVRNAFLADRRSADDFSATSHLQPGPVFSMLINRTANNPAGNVSATPYFDTGLGGPGQAGIENNNTIRMGVSNAKALGLIPGDSPLFDGTITFTTLQGYDFDRSNGINANQVDFVGVAAHEIGHLLGFISGLETLAGNATAPGEDDNLLHFVTPLDLFRFSSRSIGPGGGLGVNDWTADNTPKYFSTDGGATAIAPFATGAKFGDSYEAHHWQNNNAAPYGIMDPTAATGELLSITTNDLRALDTIGWDLAPEPTSAALLALPALIVLTTRRRQT